MDKKIYLIHVHSVIDVITNSSTELFVIDENKVEEAFKEVFRDIVGLCEVDYETEIRKLKDYGCRITFLKDIDTDSVYVFEASYHNNLLNNLINNHFNPLQEEIDYKISW